MANTDNIVYLDPSNERALGDLKDAIQNAHETKRSLRITTEGGSLRFKVGEMMWSFPYQSDQPNGGYPRAER